VAPSKPQGIGGNEGKIECIACKTHARFPPVAPQVYANVEGWCTPEVQGWKVPCILLRQRTKIIKQILGLFWNKGVWNIPRKESSVAYD